MEQENRRWLAVLDFQTGIAQLHNLAIVEAPDLAQARKKGLEAFGLVPDAILNVKTFPLDELPDGWAYFI